MKTPVSAPPALLSLAIALGAFGCSDARPSSTLGSGTIDPAGVGVGGSLEGVDPTLDTDGDGIVDVDEGSGDLDGDGVPAHLDPDELGDSGPGAGGNAGGTASGNRPAGGADGGVTSPGEFTECTGVEAEGNIERAPVDIVWVIDASCSMADEQQRIQENLEVFADNFAMAGIDANVVLITDTDIGSCTALANDPQYLYVQARVGSNDALEVLLETYPQYAGHLRPGAPTHFVVVTDDESDMAGDAFRTQMESNLGEPFTLHAIASENTGGGACSPATCDDSATGACGGALGGFGIPGGIMIPGFPGIPVGTFCGAAAPGDVYYGLADATAGLKISICSEDWGQVIDQLTTAVIASSALPCMFEMPTPPADEVLDLNKVRVDFIASGGTPVQFPRATTVDACADNNAWHYDNNDSPNQVILCPAACSSVASGGGLNITLGCMPDQVAIQ